MSEPRERRCDHPECNRKGVLGLGGTVGSPARMYCEEHMDYGMGRVFGPLHEALNRLTPTEETP